MLAKFFRSTLLLTVLATPLLFGVSQVSAAPDEHGHATTSVVAGESHGEAAVESAHGEADSQTHGAEEHGAGHHEAGPRPVFEPEHGTWFNVIARSVFATPEEKQHMAEAEERVAALRQKQASGQTLTKEEKYEVEKGVHYVAKYDWLVFTPLLWALLAVIMIGAARKARVRPVGKATSATNAIEASLEGFQNYLIGVMGEKLARKYLPLIASFFFTILVGNYLGLIPGMLATSAMPAIPIAMAIVAFIATHIIAIKETGFKSWFMHFVGEPVWLAPLNFPLHFVGELIKPISLSLRLLCNIFGEEAVVATLIGLAISFLPAWLPIPFQLPMLFLGILFGFLQALVFSTLLAIYISVLSTHHDDHGHPHTEHAHDSNGKEHIVGHPAEMTVGA